MEDCNLLDNNIPVQLIEYLEGVDREFSYRFISCQILQSTCSIAYGHVLAYMVDSVHWCGYLIYTLIHSTYAFCGE